MNGCFWHGHNVNLTPSPSPKGEGSKEIDNSECCKIPKTNCDFWVAKIRSNQERDARVQHELAAMGWHSITIWECELKPKIQEKILESLAYTLNRIFLQDLSIRHYEIPEEKPMMTAEEIPDNYNK